MMLLEINGETKEVKMARHKQIIETELLKEEEFFAEKMEKASISHLSGKHIQQFTGETYNESIHLAFEWVETLRTRKDKHQYKIELVDYYKQIFGGKCILVSYNIKEKIDKIN